MIRIAHISDSHFDERGRLDDVVKVHEAFCAAAAAAGVDLIVHGGDWFERRSTARERLEVAQLLLRLAEVAPVFGVKGNHDQPGDLELFNYLATDQRVEIEDQPVGRVAGPSIISVGPGRSVGMLPLPWFDKAHLVAQLDVTADAETTRRLTIEAAGRLLDHYRLRATALREAGIVPILVGHVLVAGSETSTGQTLIGTTVELAPSDLLNVGAAYCALGHVHKAQEWYGGRVAYSGSPHRCNYGEPEAKGWRLVTLDDDGRFVSNEFVELPARQIVLVDLDWSDPATHCHSLGSVGWNVGVGMGIVFNDRLDGALVRVRYRVRAEDLHLVDENALRQAYERQGAAEVLVEAVIVTEARARAPEIVRSQTTAEKVDAYLAAKGIVVDEPGRERLRAKVGLLEAP